MLFFWHKVLFEAGKSLTRCLHVLKKMRLMPGHCFANRNAWNLHTSLLATWFVKSIKGAKQSVIHMMEIKFHKDDSYMAPWNTEWLVVTSKVCYSPITTGIFYIQLVDIEQYYSLVWCTTYSMQDITSPHNPGRVYSALKPAQCTSSPNCLKRKHNIDHNWDNVNRMVNNTNILGNNLTLSISNNWFCL